MQGALEIENKGPPEVTTELRLKIHMVVHNS